MNQMPELKLTKLDDGWSHYECEFFNFAIEFQQDWLDEAMAEQNLVPGSAIGDVANERVMRKMFVAAAHDLINGRPVEDMSREHMRIGKAS